MNNNLDNIKTTWQDIEQTAKEISFQDNDVLSQAKLNELIGYIKKLLDLCDTNLICKPFWEKTNACRDVITKLQNSNDNNTIDEAFNTFHDTIICISPYVINNYATATAANKAINEYHSTVENYIKVIEDKKKEIDSLDLENKKLAINEIDGYHAKLFKNENSIKTQIDQAQEICNNFKSSYDSIKAQIEEIQQYRSEIFDENGVKQEISNIVNELQEKQKEIKDLTKSVNELLPSAMSAGLASAYNELNASNVKQVFWYNTLFFLSILALVLWAAVCAINPYGIMEPLDTTDLIKWMQLLINRVLLVSPVLWLILFSLKRRSECMRLQQEYAHKEAVTKSYVSFKKQIDDMKTQSAVDHTSLTKQLLETAISAIAFNASSTLDKKHGDKLLIQKLEERIKNTTGK